MKAREVGKIWDELEGTLEAAFNDGLIPDKHTTNELRLVILIGVVANLIDTVEELENKVEVLSGSKL